MRTYEVDVPEIMELLFTLVEFMPSLDVQNKDASLMCSLCSNLTI